METMHAPQTGIHYKTFEVLINLAAGDMGFLDRVLSAFLDSGNSLINQMDTFWKNGDFKSCAQSAHALKSTSRSMGALALSHLCSQVEMVAGNADPSVFSQMRQEFILNCAELKKIRADLEK